MNRNRKVPALVALCAVVGAGLVGCDDSSDSGADAASAGAEVTETDTETDEAADSDEADGGAAPEQIDVAGRSVNVSCSGTAVADTPVVVLLHGGGHSLAEMAAFQETLAEEHRVCSYDRLGAGASDAPDGPQSLDDTGEVLTAVLDAVGEDAPVVLAGHSLGGLIAARYAPDHQDRVAGLVLLDATSPTQSTDLTEEVPESADSPASDLRDETVAVLAGENPEQLVVEDGEVASAGDIPVEVVQHGQQYLAEVPEYGPAMELAWTRGQISWLDVSEDSRLLTAGGSGHDIHIDEPETAAAAVASVVARAADPERSAS